MQITCGQCGQSFNSADEELLHLCSVTGATSTDPASMGADYVAIQKAALERALARIPSEDVVQMAQQQEAIQQLDS